MRRSGNRRTRFLGVLVLAVGVLALASCGGGSDSEQDQVAEERLQQREIEQAADEAARDARQAERIRQLEKQVKEKETEPATGTAPAVEPASWTTYTAKEAGWSAEIPTGGGWSDPITSEEVAGRRWRTTIDGPGRVSLIIDATPLDVPAYNGPAQRTTVSHPVYGSATEIVFQAADSQIADCRIGTCVDYLVSDGDGGGYGVLAGGPGHSFEELQGIALRVMQSISYWDY